MRNVALILAPLLLAACCPHATVTTKPVLVETERLVVEPIPAALLIERPMATGRVSECPTVAADRRAELAACNAALAAIRAMQTDPQEPAQ